LVCQICRKPLKAGDDTRRATLFEGDDRIYVVHEHCLTEDWSRIEVGLEPFTRFANRNAKPS